MTSQLRVKYPLRWGARPTCLLSLLNSTFTKGPRYYTTARKINKICKDKKEEIKLALFADDIIVNAKKSKRIYK